ncbi:hypothetical protein T484DRAFT_1827060 [Baffinella frigidus]|nr:hypothetical protein T484DRAFT_1827060 [Cryptophyta sp. CCMP2293]
MSCKSPGKRRRRSWRPGQATAPELVPPSDDCEKHILSGQATAPELAPPSDDFSLEDMFEMGSKDPSSPPP